VKYVWIGITILGVLLAMSIGALAFLDTTTDQVAALLEEAQSLERETAMSKVQEAKALWERRYGLMAALTDHGDLEEIRQVFAELETGPEDFVTRCHALSSRIRGLAQAEMLHYYNFLCAYRFNAAAALP